MVALILGSATLSSILDVSIKFNVGERKGICPVKSCLQRFL